MLSLPHVRPMEIGDRRATGFVLVDPPAYRTGSALAKWIRRGIDFAATLPGKKPGGR
jgi:hypothetical protein